MKILVMAFAIEYKYSDPTKPIQWLVQVLGFDVDTSGRELCRAATEHAGTFDACLYEAGRPAILGVFNAKVGFQVLLNHESIVTTMLYGKKKIQMVSKDAYDDRFSEAEWVLRPSWVPVLCQVRHRFNREWIGKFPKLDSHTTYSFSEADNLYEAKWAEVMAALD